MADAKELKLQADGLSVLYVEDNQSLRENASKLLHKIFESVDVAEDGIIGFEKFQREHYDIVITDIKMPNMDGITLSQKITSLHLGTKVILMSAFDDKEYLYKAVELGVFRYLKKPVNLTLLLNILYEAVMEIHEEKNSSLFTLHLQSVFNYQSSMVVMLHNSKPVIANSIFLDYFECENIEEFSKKFDDLGAQFMQHNGFLYNHDDILWLKTIRANEKSLFHIKMKNKQDEIKHFILKYQSIPDKKDYEILSFDDVTELNLLKLFDEKESDEEEGTQDTKAMYDLLDVLQKNNTKIKVHNYYKGLSITNDAVISKILADSIIIKTTYLQQKAVQFEQKVLLISSAFPAALECSSVVKMSFESQNITLKDLHFIKTSPVMRSTIRVVPEETHTVSLFLGENKFHGDVTVEDISIDAVKLKLNALPAGLEKGSKVIIDMVLESNKKPLIINSEATMYRKHETHYSFSVVFKFTQKKKSDLVSYITKRQMAIIREFKGLQNG